MNSEMYHFISENGQMLKTSNPTEVRGKSGIIEVSRDDFEKFNHEEHKVDKVNKRIINKSISEKNEDRTKIQSAPTPEREERQK